MDNRNINIIKNSIILFLGNLSSKFISFLLIPLYSYYFLPSEFGEIDLYLTFSSIAYILFSFQAIESTFRFIQDAKSDKEKSIVLTNSMLISLFGLLLFAIFIIFSNSYIQSNYFQYLFFYVFSMVLSQLFLQALRGMKKTTIYVLMSLVSSSISLLLNILLIVFWDVGITTLFISPILANLFVSFSIFFIFKVYKYYSIQYISKLEIINQLKFSVPLIPNALSIWLLGSIGRFVLLYFYDVQSVGILSFGFKFPLLFESFIGVFFFAWQIVSVETIFDRDRDSYVSTLFLRITKIQISLISIFLPILFIFNVLFVSQNFQESIVYIPFFFIGIFFKSSAQFLNTIFYGVKKTSVIFFGTFISSLVYFLFSLLFVQRFYIHGIAFAYLIAEFFHLIIVLIQSRKLIRISFPLYLLLPNTTLLVISILILLYFDFSIIYLIVLTIINIIILSLIEKNEVKKFLNLLIKPFQLK